MFKSLIIISTLFFYGSFVSANENIIVDKNENTINKAEIEMFLKPAPVAAQLGLLKNKSEFEEKLKELYLTKAIAAEVKSVPLSPEEQLDLDEALKLYYFNLKINQLSTQNLPDFEPLAALEYKTKKQDFVEPEQVAVEHILLDTRKKYTEKEALKIAKTLIKKIKSGADFSELALQFSDDPSVKDNKGQLGLFGKGKMLKAFEDVAYQLKLNEISDPVETKYGYHILRKYDQKPSSIKAYESVKAEIIEKLKKDYVKARVDEYLEKVKATNEMKVDAQALDAYIAEKMKQLEAKAPVKATEAAGIK